MLIIHIFAAEQTNNFNRNYEEVLFRKRKNRLVSEILLVFLHEIGPKIKGRCWKE